MELKVLKHGEAWMDTKEKQRSRAFINQIKQLFSGAGVQETPLLALRVQDLVVHWILTSRLEVLLLRTPEDGPSEKSLITATDAIGKNRERIRKAMKELEDYCQKAGTPIDRGIADEMKPLLEKTRDLAENLSVKSADQTKED